MSDMAELETVEKIRNLDLEPIVYKLTHPDDPAEALTLAEADAGVALYRQFLTLIALYPERSIVPTRQIDAIWHAHILDTAKYRVDCDEIFGRFVDHFPYFGLRGADDATALKDSFAETCELFREHFGAELAASLAACGESCGPTLCEPKACDTQSCSNSLHRERPRPTRVVASA